MKANLWRGAVVLCVEAACPSWKIKIKRIVKVTLEIFE